ncbi:MAG TPA: D-alanyl-D-alanine carboxypeptidase/D-alanyl-D-alanine-endopeptidase [Pyrinomonadaceae bacterium]|nr:D-alanyl-D-alanine carboxypeptidase/D-alanyl-D-alanine-endopeptidase [Pyrinomonadaceae bacterium]
MKKTFLSLFVLSTAFAFASSAQTPITTPTPVPQPSPAVVQASVHSLADLQSTIRARLLAPELRRGQAGVKIVSMNTGKVVYEENAEKYFMPASNMKNFTVATAIEKLTPDFRFVTSVYAQAMPDAAGVVKGNVRVFGRGDVSISTAFSEGNYYKGLDDLADKIAAAGVKRIEGDLIADETYFVGNPVPGEWEWDDLQWYYGAEVSALPLNDNAIDLSVTPGPSGYSCSVKVSPYNPVVRVVNQCTTSAAGTPRTLKIEKKIDRNILEITGSLPVGNAGFNGSVTVSHPAELFVALLKERLAAKGITVTGQVRAIDSKPVVGSPDTSVEIAKLESVPLSLIAQKTMKPSQNMYTETLLWTLGEHARAVASPVPGGGVAQMSNANSADLGLSEVKRFLTEIGVAPDGIIQHDGSGLSRHNLITPAAVVQLYSYMGKRSKFSQAWRDSLTIGGVDGTLRNRFKGTKAAGNVRGKTGTIDQVSALSGYVRTAAGEELAFSMVVNGINEGSVRTAVMDAIVVNLANFDGRID